MIAITKNSPRGRHRVHVASAENRLQPVCGGGHQAKSVAAGQGWQETIEEPDCWRCLLIQKQRRESRVRDALKQQQEMIQ